MGSKYHILNLYIKRTVLSRDIVWINKTYGEYTSRRDHTKDDICILQDENKSDKWDNIKMDPVNTEDVNNEKKR